MKLLYSKKDGKISYIEIEVETQTVWEDSVTFKPLGLKDSWFMKCENILLQIKPSKMNKGLGGDSEEPNMAKRYKLILKAI